MPSITLKYTSGGTDYSQAFTAIAVKGFGPADSHVQFPQLRPGYLDGTIRKKQVGFRRRFTVDLGAVSSTTLLNFLGGFTQAEMQYVATYTYGSVTEADLRVVDLNGEEYASEWMDGVEIGRRVILELEEAAIRTSYPSGTATADTGDMLYFKKRVAITGTPTAPQTLTFGAGTLLETEGGGDFPEINNVTQVYRVDVDAGPYQEARVYMASTPSLNGSNYVTLTVAHSEAGGAASDGAYYADISLTVQTI